ncbi:MAG: galactose-1-phosphate uridylyltransferase [Planctomycetota bacterium]
MNPISGERIRWEQRWHPLRREWIVIAAHRNERPWTGEREGVAVRPPSYDPQCYLCPGNYRASGERNPDYTSVYVFDNDFPVVALQAPEIAEVMGGVQRRRAARGIARVICYDPRHNVHLADLPPDATCRVLRSWREQDLELSRVEGIRHVLFFENRGETVGVSNPHPHCQLYAVDFVFHLVEHEIEACSDYSRQTGRSLFEAILDAELESGERVIAANEHAVAFVPYFARYAYEIMIVPRAERASLACMTDAELDGMAHLFHRVVTLYDGLWKIPFPYVLAVHQAPYARALNVGAPYGGAPHASAVPPGFRVHLEFQPPLRRPGLKKYLAGPEIGGGNFMSDTWPEEKARELRAVGEKSPR